MMSCSGLNHEKKALVCSNAYRLVLHYVFENTTFLNPLSQSAAWCSYMLLPTLRELLVALNRHRDHGDSCCSL